MCRAPSISFISSPCLRPVEADPDTHCTDTEAGSGRGRHTPRSHSHQGRLGFEPALDQDWTPSCLSVHGAVDATRAWTRVVTDAQKRVWTAARKHLRSCPGRDSDAHAPWTLRQGRARGRQPRGGSALPAALSARQSRAVAQAAA